MVLLFSEEVGGTDGRNAQDKIWFNENKNEKKNYDASNRSYSIIAHICTGVKMNMDHSILKIY